MKTGATVTCRAPNIAFDRLHAWHHDCTHSHRVVIIYFGRPQFCPELLIFSHACLRSIVLCKASKCWHRTASYCFLVLGWKDADMMKAKLLDVQNIWERMRCRQRALVLLCWWAVKLPSLRCLLLSAQHWLLSWVLLRLTQLLLLTEVGVSQ